MPRSCGNNFREEDPNANPRTYTATAYLMALGAAPPA
jgi:hypothetical protein